MKNEYDFSKGKRGAIEPTPPGKKRITIRLDNEIIEWFRGQVEARGGGNYQTMINNALREYLSNSIETFEKIMRRVLREEISKTIFNIYPPPETAINGTIRTDISNFGISDSAVTPSNGPRLRRILALLETAETLDDMDLPGLNLHELKGERKGTWSVKVSGKRRVTFKIKQGDAIDVNYEDYH